MFFSFGFLTAWFQEKMRLQGVGEREFQKYGMYKLTDKRLSDFAGNAFLGLKS